MKKVLRYLLYFVIILVVAIGGMVTYVKSALPNVGPPPEMTIELTPERIERGEYLANYVMQCVDCHAKRDFSLFSGPTVPGTTGVGGEVFDQKFGFPGRYVARNITPYGIGEWTDGEVFRAITTGVSRDGAALFPIMPYHYFGQADPEDIKSVIAYLRTLDPIESHPEPSVSDFPMSIIINTIPVQQEPMKRPDPSDKKAYGKYMINAAVCGECHTNKLKGEVIGEPFAGGFQFDIGTAIVTSPNITPHETGIGSWTKEDFIGRFKQYADSSYTPHAVKPGEFQTVMPWMMYSQMTETDLGAIYDYLKTLTPINNSVERFVAKK